MNLTANLRTLVPYLASAVLTGLIALGLPEDLLADISGPIETIVSTVSFFLFYNVTNWAVKKYPTAAPLLGLLVGGKSQPNYEKI